jgi:hypothetical protein
MWSLDHLLQQCLSQHVVVVQDQQGEQMSELTPDSPTGTAAPAPRRRKHLIDPNAPRQARNIAAEKKSLTRVQQWVMSTLVVTTIIHLCGGLVFASLYLDNPEPGAEIGLNVIAGVFGMLGIAAAFMIHRKSPLTPWLVLGLAPTVIGLLLLNR